MRKDYKLYIHGAKEIVAVTSLHYTFLAGNEMRKPAILRASEMGADGLSVLVDNDGKIAKCGTDESVLQQLSEGHAEKTIDATGMCIIPGLIDAHTHPVWAGDRVHEFAMKLAGATYMDVHKAGGGIYFTVEHTKKATEEELFESLKMRLDSMIAAGTTTVEAKSGYGLDLETELKLLRVLERAKREHPIEISATYCGAHAVPRGKTAVEAAHEIITEHLPTIKRYVEDGLLTVENIDVFCEQGVYNRDQSRKILAAGAEMGLRPNFHGDELSLTHSAELAAELNANAVSHLEQISTAGIRALAESRTVAVLLPTTLQSLHLQAPPVREMLDAGCVVALGTDFNPNAYCLNMPTVMFLACTTFKMSMEEVLVASTLNAAKSLGRGNTHGAIEAGRVADMVVVDAPRWEHLIYQLGRHETLIKHVIKCGTVVHSRPTELEHQF